MEKSPASLQGFSYEKSSLFLFFAGSDSFLDFRCNPTSYYGNRTAFSDSLYILFTEWMVSMSRLLWNRTISTNILLLIRRLCLRLSSSKQFGTLKEIKSVPSHGTMAITSQVSFIRRITYSGLPRIRTTPVPIWTYRDLVEKLSRSFFWGFESVLIR